MSGLALGITGLAVSGLSTAVGMGMSISQSIQADQAAKRARRQGDIAEQRMKQLASVNEAEKLSIAMKQYEQQREALRAGTAQAMTGATEASQRGLGATAGSILRASLGQEQQIAAQAEKAQAEKERLVLQTDQQNRALETAMQEEIAKGAAQAEAFYEGQSQKAAGEAVQGGIQLGQVAMDAIPLYGQMGAKKQMEIAQSIDLSKNPELSQGLKEAGYESSKVVSDVMGAVTGIRTPIAEDGVGVIPNFQNPQQYRNFIQSLPIKTQQLFLDEIANRFEAQQLANRRYRGGFQGGRTMYGLGLGTGSLGN